MKKSRRSKSLTLTNSRWAAYAAASAATFVAGSQTAEGAIHYSGRVNVKLSGMPDKTVTFQLDRPGDSIVFQHIYHFTYFAGFKVVASDRGNTQGTKGSIITLFIDCIATSTCRRFILPPQALTSSYR